ncbi:MAG: winged helix-turn-helix transcriptional regulator [Armatimonadetes bacterium]|nr:winged helix-turn-helix transcriptional regulator [Armatimonadota bacterium]
MKSDGQALADLAGMLADPTRAEIILALMDGRAFPVSQLAAIAHVSVPTASHHLTALVDSGLVVVNQQGRHRYHGLASQQVADLIESLGAFRIRSGGRVVLSRQQYLLAQGRTCYSHAAGKLGVRLRLSLEQQGMLTSEDGQYRLNTKGAVYLRELGVSKSACTQPAKMCLDWTERVPHIGGPLGAGLLKLLLEREWVRRDEIPRNLEVTPLGVERIEEVFPLEP